MASSFIVNYVTEEEENTKALIIQKAFRNYRHVRRFKKFINMRIKYHHRLIGVCLSAWRTTTLNSSIQLHQTYDSFKDTLRHVSFFSQGRALASMRYMYVTGCLFVPNGFTAKDLIKFVFLVNKSDTKKVFKLWREAARNLVTHRKSMKSITMTAKKVKSYGLVFEIFRVWHKYSRYKRIEEVEPTLKMPKIILRDCDPSPYWFVLENKLNAKRNVEYQADFLRRKVFVKKVLKAIGSYAKGRIFLRNCLKNNIRLDVKYRFKTAIRAWREFDKVQIDKRKILHNIIHEWYRIAYKKACNNAYINFFQGKERKFFSQKILSKWCLFTRIKSIKNIKNVLSIQKNAGLCLPLAFGLSQRFEFFFQTICFRTWMRFAKRRIAWKKFMKFSGELDPDAELAYETLMMLRSADNSGPLLPNGIGISLELSLKTDDEIRKGHITEMTPVRKLEAPEVDRRANTLLRAILMYLHSRKSYDIFVLQKDAPFEKFRTEKDLRAQVSDNSKILASIFKRKIQKDMLILKAIDAHQACVASSQVLNNFTSLEKLLVVLPSENETIDENFEYPKINIYAEYKISTNAIVRAIESSPPRVMCTLNEEKDIFYRDFYARLRRPNQIVREPFEQLKNCSNNPRAIKYQQNEGNQSNDEKKQKKQTIKEPGKLSSPRAPRVLNKE